MTSPYPVQQLFNGRNALAAFIFVLSATLMQAQTTTRAYRQSINPPAVPKLVMKTFTEQYPNVMVHGWFATHITYWQNDYSSGWYQDWYGSRSVMVYSYEKPTFFEVEFINGPGMRSRAIYNIHGYWYETRSQLKGLPKPILDRLKNSQYSDWKISALKELIEANGWPVDVYRFQVTKGMRSRILRMDDEGNIVQVKNL